MNFNKSIGIKILAGITISVLLFHLLILFKIIPYETTWGGRLKTEKEMYVFETVSILINSFYLYILFQKGRFVNAVLSEKTLSVILWIFFGIFVLNTIGNIIAQTILEKTFAIVTLVNALLLSRINKKEAVNPYNRTD